MTITALLREGDKLVVTPFSHHVSKAEELHTTTWKILALIIFLKDLLGCIKWSVELKHFMGALDLTVKVSNISPKTSRADLIFFFSYCGTVDEIQMHRVHPYWIASFAYCLKRT
ncbi:hypothetical protein BHM03_00036173 [Ensete ventricosum]|nr:hypothetical protein BHM03_00036173 [Ensete ventricosum]